MRPGWSFQNFFFNVMQQKKTSKFFLFVSVPEGPEKFAKCLFRIWDEREFFKVFLFSLSVPVGPEKFHKCNQDFLFNENKEKNFQKDYFSFRRGDVACCSVGIRLPFQSSSRPLYRSKMKVI